MLSKRLSTTYTASAASAPSSSGVQLYLPMLWGKVTRVCGAHRKMFLQKVHLRVISMDEEYRQSNEGACQGP